jgi:alcohol dehydrogenase class IV
MKANWNYPTAIRAGAGRLTELAECCRQTGMRKPLLVTDPGLAGLPMIERAMEICRQGGLEVALFCEVKPNPSAANVEAGVSAFLDGGHDGVIAFGGGSGLDAAKAVALMARQSVSVFDLEDVGDNWTRADAGAIAPIVAVPTTAGTGSEVGRASVIVDEQAHLKKIIFHPRMLPAIVILDPELTVGLPRALTAATGMDALSHNLEALCSPLFHPMAEGIGMEGARLVHEYLPRAVEDGSDLEARMQMLVASSMGATAFQRGLGAMHALAHPLGALFDAHHGTLNAILMPYVLRANATAIGPVASRLARYLDLPGSGLDAVIDWVLELRSRIGIPETLAGIGIDAGRAHEIGRMAVADPSASTNPIHFSEDQYAAILERAVSGEL